jgi:hypothetical protein
MNVWLKAKYLWFLHIFGLLLSLCSGFTGPGGEVGHLPILGAIWTMFITSALVVLFLILKLYIKNFHFDDLVLLVLLVILLYGEYHLLQGN